MASQQLSNDGSYLTETRHRHKSSQMKILNEQGLPNIVNAANHKHTHSPQISMSFCLFWDFLTVQAKSPVQNIAHNKKRVRRT